ncbi:hypothetical protein KGQ19_21630 [Catenulispora sp. NL8]|uniref:Uncharacterized protein n=1 Tax=Catenulispora pinistramenti TaxID=2705254 RepID=A0ABS5KTV9_9ACTN|nr:hypothetical protein [Catenulispora pinistramenti]MBS2549468.1 hypothetical protein [Catenulispora pinistramenti]
MAGFDGEKLGRWSLRVGAAYCAVLGSVAALAAAPLARWVALPEAVLALAGAGAGAVVVVWAGLVLWLLSRVPLRWALRLVMAVNVVAAGVVAVVALRALSETAGGVWGSGSGLRFVCGFQSFLRPSVIVVPVRGSGRRVCLSAAGFRVHNPAAPQASSTPASQNKDKGQIKSKIKSHRQDQSQGL